MSAMFKYNRNYQNYPRYARNQAEPRHYQADSSWMTDLLHILNLSESLRAIFSCWVISSSIRMAQIAT